MATPAIVLDHLSKKYAGTNFYALKDLSLEVKSGEIYGFLGANGAGKSTSIRCLLNFLRPTAGSAKILGHDTVKESVRIKNHVGYLSGEIALFPKMNGGQFLRYMTELQPFKNKDYFNSLVHNLKADLSRPLGELSKGNKQKIGLIQAFMHEPEVLILDEPTSGLDPLMQEVFYDMLKAARDRGAGVFVSSHNLSEVQRMCDRIGFIREGELVAEKNIGELVRTAAHTFEITFGDKAPRRELEKLPKAQVEVHGEHHVTLILPGDLAPLFAILAKHKVVVFDQKELNLEDEFLSFYGKEEA
jgi:ABC-2 type transport system ATP-binding protein